MRRQSKKLKDAERDCEAEKLYTPDIQWIQFVAFRSESKESFTFIYTASCLFIWGVIWVASLQDPLLFFFTIFVAWKWSCLGEGWNLSEQGHDWGHLKRYRATIVLSSLGQLSIEPVNAMHIAVTSVYNTLLIIVTQIHDTVFVSEVTNLQIYLQVFEKKVLWQNIWSSNRGSTYYYY
jgi:hypothetical protein